MSLYAMVQEGTLVNIIEADAATAAGFTRADPYRTCEAVDISNVLPAPNIGWTYDGERKPKWAPPGGFVEKTESEGA